MGIDILWIQQPFKVAMEKHFSPRHHPNSFYFLEDSFFLFWTLIFKCCTSVGVLWLIYLLSMTQKNCFGVEKDIRGKQVSSLVLSYRLDLLIGKILMINIAVSSMYIILWHFFGLMIYFNDIFRWHFYRFWLGLIMPSENVLRVSAQLSFKERRFSWGSF